MKKLICAAAAWLLASGILLLPVCASGIDPDRTGSIKVVMSYEDAPVPGGTLDIYHVADIAPQDRGDVFRYTDSFSACGVALDDLGQETAAALAAYVETATPEGQCGRIDAEGIVQFRDLTPGLYLLVQNEPAEGFRKLLPFLISIPNNHNGTYVYDVVSTPKQELAPESSEPTEPPQPTQPPAPTEPYLPQTGQTRWPIPLLAVTGGFLIALGVLLLKRDGKCHDET